jgi:4-hydroxy-tetrahydrodipicolinate synthase
MPAITTCFNEDLTIDHEFTARHVRWLIEAGCAGIVTPGSLGEGATLTRDEKIALWKTCVAAVDAPVVAAISALSTAEATDLAQAAQDAGCRGLMVLPPYVYQSDWREMKAHVAAIMRATPLPCMLYNNPIAYGTDFRPAHIAELAHEHANLQAVKESSGDARRFAAIREILGDKLTLFVGMDDALLEGVAMGAKGWIAGLVNALPRESVALFDYAMAGDTEKAFALYRWFLPLLRLDTVPKFVQLIKLVQQEVGLGHERVRPPRLEITGAERETTLALIREALAHRHM